MKKQKIEEEALGWFRKYYLFEDDDSMLEKHRNPENQFLEEYITLKKENNSGVFYDEFLDGFRKCKKETLEKYKAYRDENNIDNLSNMEDKESNELREKIVEYLNRERIL